MTGKVNLSWEGWQYYRNAEQFFYLMFSFQSHCWLVFIDLCTAVGTTFRRITGFKTVAAGIAVIKAQPIFTLQFFMESFRKLLWSSGIEGS